jgi:hypothetical protein
VTATSEHGQARIFWEVRIGLRKLAKKELRAFGGGDEAGVEAIRAKTERGGKVRG